MEQNNNINIEDKNYFRELGDKEYKLKNYPKAIEYFKKYLENNQKDAVISNIVGYLYSKVDKYAFANEEIYYYKRAIELMPDLGQAIRNLAFAYQKTEDYKKSVECFQKLLSLNEAIPDDAYAYGCLKIKLGDFEEGWKAYEARFLKTYGRTVYPNFVKPCWQGECIKNRTLLVQCEQGFGDTFMFFRYLDLIKPLAKKIIFRSQDALVDLLKLNEKEVEIVGESTKIEDLDFDYHVALLSLPYILKTKLDTIPPINNYFKADKEKVLKYKKEFFDNDCLKIGITWHGLVAGNKRRDVRINAFKKLAQIKNVKVYSFQKDFYENDIEKVRNDIEIINLGGTFKTFSDTAAAMENIDLFITSDDVVFNLAAVMGKKIYLLLNKFSEWRWMLDDKKTPWYKTVKIFKKKYENDLWESLMNNVVKDIIQHYN